jgi:hypothetical protein
MPAHQYKARSRMLPMRKRRLFLYMGALRERPLGILFGNEFADEFSSCDFGKRIVLVASALLIPFDGLPERMSEHPAEQIFLLSKYR